MYAKRKNVSILVLVLISQALCVPSWQSAASKKYGREYGREPTLFSCRLLWLQAHLYTPSSITATSLPSVLIILLPLQKGTAAQPAYASRRERGEGMGRNKMTEKREDFFQYISSTIRRQLRGILISWRGGEVEQTNSKPEGMEPNKTTEKVRTSSNIFSLRSRGNCDARHSRQLTRRRAGAGPEGMEPNKTTEKKQDFFQYIPSTIERQLWCAAYSSADGEERWIRTRGWNQIRRQKKERTSSNILPLRSGGNCDARHSCQLTGRGDRADEYKTEGMEPNKTTEKREDFFQYISSTIGRQLWCAAFSSADAEER